MSDPASDPAPDRAPDPGALPPAEQARGRKLAVASHPFSMTYRVAVTGDLATQGLVTLQASEAAVGLAASLGPFATLAQVPTLGLMARIGKRRLLLWTQVAALLCGLPLVFFADLAALPPAQAAPLALTSLALTTLSLVLGSTAWWPLLHGYVEAGETGRFFAALRSLWHLGLIAFFGFCTLWLARHPGGFGVLFGVAWACGLARAVLLRWFPERHEGRSLEPRLALRALLGPGLLRRHLLGVTLDWVAVRSVPPFAIVMLRREVELSEAQTITTTLAMFVGGLLALYPAGRLVDRLGSRPVLLATCALRAALVAALAGAVLVQAPGGVLALVVALFLLSAALTAAFSVAEVKVLFQLASRAAPSSVIVLSVVLRNVVAGGAALLAGLAVDRALRAGYAPLAVYQAFFLAAAGVQAAALAPLWGLRLDARASQA